MNYIKVSWIHNFLDEPVELYMELDDESWEKRKIEVYADGRSDFASELGRSGTTQLSECQMPPLREIALDPQFRPEIISAGTFEALWSTATEGGKWVSEKKLGLTNLRAATAGGVAARPRSLV